MVNIRRILAPTDLSEISRAGVRQALELARAEGAEIILYHVIGSAQDWSADHQKLNPAGPVLENQSRRLNDFIEETCGDSIKSMALRQIVEFGVPYKSIVEKAAAESVDLIVMSTHGRTGFNHLLLGSVTERVIARASCPVLIVPARHRAKALAA